MNLPEWFQDWQAWLGLAIALGVAELFSLVIRQVVPFWLIARRSIAGLGRHVAIVRFVSGNVRRTHGVLLCDASETRGA